MYSFLRWQYTKPSTEASDSVHNSFNVGNMYFLKLQSTHHQNYAIVNLQSSLSLLQTNFACSFPGVFIAFKTKNPTLPKLITKKDNISERKQKIFIRDKHVWKICWGNTSSQRIFPDRAEIWEREKKLQLKVGELNRNNRSKAIHTQSLPPVAASISRRWVIRGIPTALRWVPGSLPVLISVKSFSN